MSENATKPRSGVAIAGLFAWRVFADGGEAMVIAFARSRNEARKMARGCEWLYEFEWTEIKATREPRADQWAGKTPELLDGSGLKSQQVMHALGWQSIDSPSCEWCGAGEFELVPESRVSVRDDHDMQEICDGCYAHEHSQANELGQVPAPTTAARNSQTHELP